MDSDFNLSLSGLRVIVANIYDDIKNSLDRPLALTGMMGAGKSYIGKKLAYRLSLPFYDSDKLIEQETGKRISEIFSAEGENVFRAMEKTMLLNLLQQGPCVISTGGGCIENEELRQAIRNHAIGIWIKADIKALQERLKKDETRPLLKGGDMQGVLRKLLAEREPYYCEAPIHVDNVKNRDAVEDLINKILKFIQDKGVPQKGNL